MKKTTLFLLLTAILLTVMIPMTAVAETPRDYAENLIAYWDFEGTNGEQFNDKGTGDAIKNDIKEGNCVVSSNQTGYGEAVAPVTFANGKVTIPNSDGTALIANIAVNDGFSNLNAVTLGMKVNIATSATNVYLAWRTNSFGLKMQKVDNETYNLIYHSSAVTNNADYYGDPFGGKAFSVGKDYYIFVTVVANGANVSITGYYSENGKTFVAGETISKATKWSGYAWRNADGTDITIGKAMNVYAPKGSELTYDDIWVFNTAVSSDSLSTIVRNKINYATDNSAVEAPAYRGVQLSPVSGNAFSARLVATVDSLNYAEVGFEVKVADYKGAEGATAKIYGTDAVYKSITGKDADSVGSSVVYTAADLGGEYIYALAINNIPTDGVVTFAVTTYYKATAEGERIPGVTYTVTVDNGRLVSQAVVASEA